jgi:hypothetical protein
MHAKLPQPKRFASRLMSRAQPQQQRTQHARARIEAQPRASASLSLWIGKAAARPRRQLQARRTRLRLRDEHAPGFAMKLQCAAVMRSNYALPHCRHDIASFTLGQTTAPAAATSPATLCAANNSVNAPCCPKARSTGSSTGDKENTETGPGRAARARRREWY